ncbi:hypothetical protein WJ0W_004701 [Paenibacillus melissococcoides]|uniref:Uncharacterized protein n=2 Tax=Paenibacillus melissococcoides TaxID=2912268 RepID=A0ABM9G6I6_9BACL|nr:MULTISPECIES: hypothetical protein [Paenibacillus]MEB9893003.1 hypothetical protein [Bacillus cereus]CAH8247467.1 hypothetical protein WJ0W_004701 [Paenibacillus melissococcoides]CAH8705057.1 hypothetical protein WDD9_000848 [Paenibacillus melissococcoides]CAH8708282.1 hypothetical protein HTL2_001934 [Paenibacillus melissococcoides]CAH8714485.1 hypothetical protein WDD9_003905 [Paenibacillus melissococcoides]
MNDEKKQLLRERLKRINEAIDAIMFGGQEYTIDNRRLRRSDLGTLLVERDRIERELAIVENDGIFTAAVFWRR